MPRRVGAYAKLLSKYASDDAIIAAGEKAELLFVRGLAFCATSDSDGYITEGQVERVVGAGMRDAKARARTLVQHGLWVAADGGYQIRSWTKIHESAEEKGRVRATDRERKRAERASESDRSPTGHVPDSEQVPSNVTPESLDCSYVSSGTRTEQSKAIQSNALVVADAEPSKPERPDVEALCEHLATRIEANGANRPTVTAKWRDACRLMLERDHRTPEQIRAAIDWCQADEFWRANILSMPKLREKYDQLSLQAQRQRPPGGGRTSTTVSRVGQALDVSAQLAAEGR